MEIRDVIENMRVDILSLKLRHQALASQQEMLERFTWNMITLLNANETHIEITLEDSNGTPTSDDSTLF